MATIVQLFLDAGFWAYPVLAAGLVGTLAVPVLAFVGSERALSPVLFVLGPALVVGAGALGWQQGVTVLLEVVATVAGPDKELLAYAGFSEASSPFFIAGFVTAFVAWWTLLAVVVRSRRLGGGGRAWMPAAALVVIATASIGGAAALASGGAGVVAAWPLLAFFSTGGVLAVVGASRFPAAPKDAPAEVGAAALGLGTVLVVGVAALAQALRARAHGDALTVAAQAPADQRDVLELYALEVMAAVTDAGAVAALFAAVLGVVLIAAAGNGVRALVASRPFGAGLAVVLVVAAVAGPSAVAGRVSSYLDAIPSQVLEAPEGFEPAQSSASDRHTSEGVLILTRDGGTLSSTRGPPTAILADARLDARLLIDRTRDLSAKIAALYPDSFDRPELVWMAGSGPVVVAEPEAELSARIAALGGRPRTTSWAAFPVHAPGDDFRPRAFPFGLHVEASRITLRSAAGAEVISDAKEDRLRVEALRRRALELKASAPRAYHLLVSVAAGVSVGALVSVLDAIREMPDGGTLFPTVYFVDEKKLTAEAWAEDPALGDE